MTIFLCKISISSFSILSYKAFYKDAILLSLSFSRDFGRIIRTYVREPDWHIGDLLEICILVVKQKVEPLNIVHFFG